MIVSHRNREPVCESGSPKRGAALIIALFSVVLLATIVSAAAFVSQQEYRGSRNTLVEQRAFAVSEYGLNAEISNWPRDRNLPPPVGMMVGALDTTRVYVASGDSARVSIKRISDNAFWVISEGRANIGLQSLESGRQTGAYVRLAYPSITPKGAITSAGNVTVQGNAEANGYEHVPAWAHCASIPGDTVPAVAVGPSNTVNYGPQNITSSPAVVYDPAAADSNTYVRYGSESWNSLTTNADITLPGGVMNMDIFPVVNASGRCDYSVNTNWGEPWRPGTTPPCYNYYPIVYVQSDLHLNGTTRGQGILMVNGDLEINGIFDFYGLVIVRDDLVKGNGTATITGAVFAGNLTDNSPLSWLVGDQDVFYSTCAVESVLRGSAILTRVTQRHWSQIF